jgi:hypothetical protein
MFGHRTIINFVDYNSHIRLKTITTEDMPPLVGDVVNFNGDAHTVKARNWNYDDGYLNVLVEQIENPVRIKL